MKRIALFLIAIVNTLNVHAQSDTLKAVYQETCRILKNYSFSSDTAAARVYYDNNFGTKYNKYSTKSIKLIIDKGRFVFYINDSCYLHSQQQYYLSGIYILTTPINNVKFELGSCYGKSCVRMICNNGMTLSHRGKEKMFTEYRIVGENSSIKVLYNSLIALQERLKNDDFQESLTQIISPSIEIKTAYNNVIKTLKEYNYRSGDTWHEGNTKSISLKIQNGFFIFTFVDTGIMYDSRHSFGRDGTKIVKVPISHVVFNNYDNQGVMNISSSTKDNIEITWRGKKEIVENYKVFGSEPLIKKLREELDTLLILAIEEGYYGTLDGISNKQQKTTSTTPKPKKEETPATQPQQRQRNHVPRGN